MSVYQAFLTVDNFLNLSTDRLQKQSRTSNLLHSFPVTLKITIALYFLAIRLLGNDCATSLINQLDYDYRTIPG